MEHETGEGDEMQAGKGLGQALVVAGEATEAGQPGEAALHDPAPGQQDEALLGLGEFDHLEADALGRCLLGGVLTPVALIDVPQLDAVAGRFLDGCRQALDLCPGA